jgi:hypothetical protein
MAVKIRRSIELGAGLTGSAAGCTIKETPRGGKAPVQRVQCIDMGIPPSDLDAQAQAVKDKMESGLDLLEEYGGPMLDRYGRTAIVIGVAVVATVGVALMLARRRRRHTLTERLQRAIPEVGSRLEGPMSSIRSAAGRLSR